MEDKRNARGSSLIRPIDLFLFLLMSSATAYFLVLPFRNVPLRHFIVTVGSVIFYCIALYRLVKTKYSVRQFLLILTELVIVSNGVFFGSRRVDTELLYASLNFFSLFIILSTQSHYSMTRRSVSLVSAFAIFSALLFLIVSQTSVAYLFEDGRNNGSLALGMTNPNLTGMILSAVLGILLIRFNKTEKKWGYGILIFSLMVLLYKTGSRSALITGFILALYAVFFSQFRIPNYIIVFCILIPIISIPFYLFLFRVLPSDFLILGKPLFSGRQATFQQIFDSFSSVNGILFGNVAQFGFQNATNAFLTMYLSCGLIGASIAYYLYMKRLLTANNDSVSRDQHVALACILSFFIQSAAESFMFLGIFPGVVFIYIYSLFICE